MRRGCWDSSSLSSSSSLRQECSSEKRDGEEKSAALKAGKGKVRKLIDNYGNVFTYSVNIRVIPLLGLTAGFFSGLLGIGVPIHLSAATSMFIMIFT
ncbi:TPA: hypothetical protein EYP75_04295, partial [Candidatus Bathyarchaeota archaeon]|nr:hypothetical protein [Candidatus Bathyarchaeota archaeon]